MGCGGDSTKPRKSTGIQITSHFPSGEAVPDAALGANPDLCPDRLVGGKGIKKCFPLIPGVSSFLSTPKCASCGSQPYQDLDTWLVILEMWLFLGAHIFLAHIWEGLCTLLVKTALHTDINPCTGKQGDRWPLLPRVTKHRMQMI